MTKAVSQAEVDHAARPRHLTPELLARWESSLTAWGAPAPVVEAWRALGDPRTRIIVTGQQPGPWGGPLYTFYKAATAIALAQHLAARDRIPAVAVFWMQTEDTDWGEIGWGALPGRDLRLVRHRFEAAVPARHWVGSANLTDPPEARAVVEEWGEDPGDVGPAAHSYELGPRFARALLTTFGSAGLLPLDGRWPELRHAGRGLWERYLPRHRELASDVLARGREGASSSPLDAAASSQGLFVLDGEKRRPVDPATWEHEVAETLAADPARLAPSVLLRAPLQDHLFGSAAHVVGKVEAAYLEQLHPVYAALGIAAPVRVPRLTATIFPRGLVPVEEQEPALADPETWIAGQASAHVPAAARGTLSALRREFNAAWEHIEAQLGQEQEAVETLGSVRRKVDFELKRLDETLERRGRRDMYRAEPRLRHLAEFLRPRRGPQERGISSAMLYLLFGEDVPTVLADAARRHVTAWSEGRTAPRILEATRV